MHDTKRFVSLQSNKTNKKINFMAKQENKLELTGKMLAECKHPKDIMELPAVRDRWVNTYNMTSGRQDGDLKFEAEKVLFIQTVSESATLAKCTQMSIYSSFILLAVSGLSLRDDQAYLVPYKDKCGFMVGWKGRLEQITQIPGVERVNEPICVFDGEEFEYEINEGEYKVVKHRPLLNTQGREILAVYCTIRQAGHVRTFLMKREEVLSIRDRFSASYKDYMKIPVNGDGKRMKKYKDKQTQEWKEFEVEAPMWVTDEVQAFKKTLIRRIYNTMSKTGAQKYLDTQIKEFVKEVDSESEHVDEDEFARKVQANLNVEDTPYEELSEEQINAELDKTAEQVNAQSGAQAGTATVEPQTVKAEEVKPTIVAEDDDDTF